MITSGEQTIQGHSTPSLPVPNKFITHHPKYGVNPLVDAAAYLFSIIGKLKQLATYHHLKKLHQELFQELNAFQDAAKAQSYSADFILVARYALAATLDDLIANSSWGSQGQWTQFSLLATLNQDTDREDRFFIILERISKDPSTYIDVMELMYICLSLGYKGHYRATEFSNIQLEQITYVLYKNIRLYRGDFSKTLSSFPSKPSGKKPLSFSKKSSMITVVLLTLVFVLILFAGLGFLLDLISKQIYQELFNIGKLILL